MSILHCECTMKMTNDYTQVDNFRSPKYEIMHHEDHAITLKVYACLAGGEYFTVGSADVVDGCLCLDCDTRAGETIVFELVPWEITFAIRYEGELNPEPAYFRNERLAKRTS